MRQIYETQRQVDHEQAAVSAETARLTRNVRELAGLIRVVQQGLKEVRFTVAAGTTQCCPQAISHACIGVLMPCGDRGGSCGGSQVVGESFKTLNEPWMNAEMDCMIERLGMSVR